MSTRTIRVEVPAAWTDEEVAQRLGRLRWPELTADQAAKRAERVELESRELDRLVRAVEKIEETLGLLEATAARKEAVKAVAEALNQVDSRVSHLAAELAEETQNRQFEVAHVERTASERCESLEQKQQDWQTRIQGSVGYTKGELTRCRFRLVALEEACGLRASDAPGAAPGQQAGQ